MEKSLYSLADKGHRDFLCYGRICGILENIQLYTGISSLMVYTVVYYGFFAYRFCFAMTVAASPMCCSWSISYRAFMASGGSPCSCR